MPKRFNHFRLKYSMFLIRFNMIWPVLIS